VLENDSEPQALGGLLLARIAFVLKLGGSHLLDDVLARLAPNDVAILRKPIQPGAWYAVALHHRVDDAIASVVSPGDRSAALIHMGRASADEILASGDRPHIRVGAPEFFLEAVPPLYSAHHSGGCREYMRLDDNSAVIRTIERRRVVPADDCWTVVGWLQRGMELSGAESALVTETCCRAMGARYCEYVCEWLTVR
jgi:hypothetical protein